MFGRFYSSGRKPYYSVFDLFKIGVGPSSSHTNAPMIAGNIFAQNLKATGLAERASRLKVDLFGSLALTGAGHGTMRAVAQGLAGNHPETVPVSDNFLSEQSGTMQIVLTPTKTHFILSNRRHSNNQKVPSWKTSKLHALLRPVQNRRADFQSRI